MYGPYLPEVYIKIIPHPHSVDDTMTIMALESGNMSPSSSQASTTFIPAPESRPWAPFRTRADFEYTETAVKGLLSKNLINKQLAGFNDGWSMGRSHLTICTYKDMQKSLAQAQEYIVQVSCTVLLVSSYAKLHPSLKKTRYQGLIKESVWNLNSSIATLGNMSSILFRTNPLHLSTAGTLCVNYIVMAQGISRSVLSMNRIPQMLGGKLM
jgi:hypothetical protein